MNGRMAKRVALSALLVVLVVLIWSAAVASPNHPCLLKSACEEKNLHIASMKIMVVHGIGRTPEYESKPVPRRGTNRMMRREK